MFEFTEETIGQIRVLHLSGKMMGDVHTQAMCTYLAELIESGAAPFLVMDFDKVKWINSTGVGTIIACLTASRRQGGDIHFANLRDMPKRYFQLTKLETVVRTYGSVAEAVDDFAVIA